MLSLSEKFVMFSCLLAVLTAVIMGVVNYYRVVELTKNADLATLRTTNELIASQFRAAIAQAKSDAISVSQMPPFQGLVHSTVNHDIDPYDGSTSKQWRVRLQTIFRSVMTHRPDYEQMRFIGIANNGRELVRTDRKARYFVDTQPEDLQEKGDESYFQDVLELKGNQVYFSEVSLNRDHGKINYELPVIRVIVPVRTESGGIFGMMVINAHAGRFIQRVLSEIDTREDVHVLTDGGDWMARSQDGTISQLRYGGASAETAPEIVRSIMGFDRGTAFAEERNSGVDNFILIADVPFMSMDDSRFLRIALVIPVQDALAKAYETRGDVAQMTLFIAFVVSVLAFFAARQVSKPFQNVIDTIRSYEVGQGTLDLPLQRGDEIGDLSRALHYMAGNLETFRESEQRMIEKLQRSNEDLDEFAYIASHDLKEPLRGIYNHAQFLSEDYAEILGTEGNDRIQRLQHLCQRADTLTSELLTYSRLGRSDLAVEEVDLNGVVDRVRNDFSVLLDERNAKILQSEPLPPAVCDRVRIESVYQNMIMNAIKYNARDEITIEVGYCAEVQREGTTEHDVYFVRDNGIGITPQHKDSVFKMFKRLNSEKTFGSGTGAGLAFVHKIIERHNGKIWFESVPEDGTTFFFTLRKTT